MPCGPKGESRPADVIGAAVKVMRIATGEEEDERPLTSALAGVSDEERRIMGRLLRMRPEPHKDASKPTSARADAQRRRREKEREAITGA